MACDIIYNCECACALLGAISVDGTSYEGVDDPETVQEAGQFQLLCASDNEDPRCDCQFSGTVTMYEDGDTELSSVEILVDVTIHDSDSIYVELSIASLGLTFKGYEVGAVGWLYQYKCWDFTPLAPTDPDYPTGGYNGTPYSAAMTLENSVDPGDTAVFTLGGDYCCKSSCVTHLTLDDDFDMHVKCLDNPECPEVAFEPWPWRESAHVVRDPAAYFDNEEDMPKYDTYLSTRDPMYLEDEGGTCALDCCDVFAGNVTQDEWWLVSGWDIIWPEALDDYTRYCFEWCDVTYYRMISDIAGFVDADKPTMTLEVPCGVDCKVYGMNSSGDPGVLIGSVSGREGASLGYNFLEFRSDRVRFKDDPLHSGYYECVTGPDGNPVPDTEEYEHVCGVQPGTAPEVDYRQDPDCGGWYCAEVTPGCGDGLAILVSYSWTGTDLCKDLGDHFGGEDIWSNGEERLVCSSTEYSAACRHSVTSSGAHTEAATENAVFGVGNYIGFRAQSGGARTAIILTPGVTSTFWLSGTANRLVNDANVNGIGSDKWFIYGKPSCGVAGWVSGTDYSINNSRIVGGAPAKYEKLISGVQGSMSYDTGTVESGIITLTWSDVIRPDV